MWTAGGTGSITLTPGDDFTVDAGDDVSIDAAGSLFLKQDSTNILSWNDAGAVTVSAVSGQDLTMSGDDVVLKSEASSTLALKQDSTNILSWDAAGAVTVSAVSNQDVSVLSNAASSGTGGAVSISGGSVDDVDDRRGRRVDVVWWRRWLGVRWRRWCRDGVQWCRAHERCGDDIERRRGDDERRHCG